MCKLHLLVVGGLLPVASIWRPGHTGDATTLGEAAVASQEEPVSDVGDRVGCRGGGKK